MFNWIFKNGGVLYSKGRSQDCKNHWWFSKSQRALWPASGVNSKRDAQSPCSWTGICPESLLRGWHVPRVPAPGLTQVPNYSFSDFFCTVFTTNVKYFKKGYSLYIHTLRMSGVYAPQTF